MTSGYHIGQSRSKGGLYSHSGVEAMPPKGLVIIFSLPQEIWGELLWLLWVGLGSVLTAFYLSRSEAEVGKKSSENGIS